MNIRRETIRVIRGGRPVSIQIHQHASHDEKCVMNLDLAQEFLRLRGEFFGDLMAQGPIALKDTFVKRKQVCNQVPKPTRTKRSMKRDLAVAA